MKILAEANPMGLFMNVPMYFEKTQRINKSVLSFALFIMAYITVIIAFTLIWRKFPELLYNYRDGEYNLWISLKYIEWAHPFDLTSINPLQGMTSMLVTLNSYFDPGQWVFFLKLPNDLKILSSYG